MKNIGKIIKKITGFGGVVVATFYLTALSLNQLSNNKEQSNKFYHSVSKAEGAFGYIMYTHYDNSYFNRDTVLKGRWLTSKFLTDGKPYGGYDGLVDKISYFHFGTNRILYREKDYEKFKEEFDEADKLLAETKERFKELFIRRGY